MVGFDFLYQNKILLDSPEPLAVKIVIDLTAKDINEDQLAILLRENSNSLT